MKHASVASLTSLSILHCYRDADDRIDSLQAPPPESIILARSRRPRCVMVNSSSLCIPAIHVTTDEQAQYDSIASRLLRKAVAEYSNFHGYIDTDDWSLVRKKQQMSIYRSLSGTDDPHVTLMVGTGLIPGTLEDVMDGLYADNTYDFRTMKTLITNKFVDGAVLNVSEKRIPEAPFRFAGIKWAAGKAAWGVVKHRDILTYERMGATMDAHGNELAFHVLQSIERPEWFVDAVREVKRARTATCYLYRRCNSRVQCFVWAESYDIGSTSRRVAEYVIAGALLSVVRSVACAEAKKCSKLIADARGKAVPSNVVCHVCHKSSGVFDHLRTCSGCIQKVCKSCSQHRPIFEINQRTGRPVEDRFCKLCISKVVTAPLFSQQPIPRKSAHSDPGVLVRRTPVFNKARREKAQSAPQRFLAQSRHIKRPLLGMDSDPLSSDDEVEYAC